VRVAAAPVSNPLEHPTDRSDLRVTAAPVSQPLEHTRRRLRGRGDSGGLTWASRDMERRHAVPFTRGCRVNPSKLHPVGDELRRRDDPGSAPHFLLPHESFVGRLPKPHSLCDSLTRLQHSGANAAYGQPIMSNVVTGPWRRLHAVHGHAHGQQCALRRCLGIRDGSSQHRDRVAMPGCRRASPTPRMRVVHGGKRRRRARPASAALAFASNLARRGARATGRHRSHWVLGEGGGRTWTRGRRLSAAVSDCRAVIICWLAVSHVTSEQRIGATMGRGLGPLQQRIMEGLDSRERPSSSTTMASAQIR
jgi:hypothetical protein